MLRKEKIEAAQKQQYDVAIIGGGITGAGIFLKCCEMGLKTIVIDRDDFASGTSCRSAKMIHGGLRYLQYMQIKLVKEALEEREQLLTRYKHLVHPLPFLLPIYDSGLAKVKMKIGLTGYDKLAGKSLLPKHRALSKAEIMQTYPMLKQKGLKGGFYYFDAITNDARLTNEVIMEGCEHGGMALNYLYVFPFDQNDKKVSSLRCRDELTGEEVEIRANHYISATGIWTDDILNQSASTTSIMKPSKGVHLVVDGSRFPDRDVILIPCEDKRFIWICPWEDNLVNIGATDTPFEGDLREPGTTEDDVKYLLTNVNNYLIDFQLTEDDILSVFSGLRPLLNEGDEDDPVKMSRDYKIWWERDDLLAIAGGKLTSFLSMADQVILKLKERLEAEKQLEISPLSLEQDGETRQMELLEGIRDESTGYNQKLKKGLNWELAHVIFFIRYQSAQKISDILSRRLSLSYGMKPFDEVLVHKVADLMQQELQWSPQIREQQEEDFRTHWEVLHSWTK